jgi:hypothetical protein
MDNKHSRELRDRLNRYSRMTPASKSCAAIVNRSADWAVYAAAFGAAVAGATNAAAAVVNYTGGPITVSAASNTSAQSVQFGPGPLLHLFAQNLSFSRTGFQGKRGIAAVSGFQFLGQNLSISRFGTNQRISAAAGSFQYGHFHLKTRSAGSSTIAGKISGSSGQWASGVTGFAGFRFQTNSYSSTARINYGWLELKMNMSVDNYPDSVTLLAGAYDDSGSPITTPGATPEPGTAGLLLLAMGAAGVTALRRRKKQDRHDAPAASASRNTADPA